MNTVNQDDEIVGSVGPMSGSATAAPSARVNGQRVFNGTYQARNAARGDWCETRVSDAARMTKSKEPVTVAH